MRHEEWLTLFADRDEPRARIAEVLRALAGQGTSPKARFPILQFYGVSGQGKTALFRKTQIDAPGRYPNIQFAFLDLADLSPSSVKEPVEVLWNTTHALAKAGIAAPLTFCLYANYWRRQNAGQEFRLQDTPLKDYLERSIRGCEILSPFTELVHLVSDVGQAAFKTVAVIERCWASARMRASELKIADLRREEPGAWGLERIQGAFSEFLATDILTHLTIHGDQNVCLAVDTFERLEPGAEGDACERLFQDLCARLVDPRDQSGQPSAELRGRSAVLLFGREKLRWQRHERPGATDPWSNYIETCELAGFTKADAEAFLRNDYVVFWAARREPEVVQQLQKHEEAILDASDERDGGSTYLPYYLRLAGEMIYEQGVHFVPEMLGRSPDEMQQRFVKYLRERSPEKLSAMRTLALALYFDDDLFDHLVQGNYIHGIPVRNMVPALLSNRSYVRRFESSKQVSYRFHRHMQQALLDDLEKNPEDIQAANKAIEAMLEYYSACGVFSKSAEFRPTTHLTAYEHGMEVLLTHTERGWIPRDRANHWLENFEKPFDIHTAATVRVRMLERVLQLWSILWGSDHPNTATVLNNLALLYFGQGRYDKAEPLYQRSLAIREKTLGSEHQDTACTLNSLAVLYTALARYEQAERLYHRVLAIFDKAAGRDHPTTATVLNNLAELCRVRRRYEEAEPLYQRAIAIFDKAVGQDDPNAVTNINNLAELYRDQGRYDEAEPLYQRAIAICEKALGPDHPNTATVLNNLALLYFGQGRYDKAEPLYQRALAICEKKAGPEHPDTAGSLHNLAGLYCAQRRYAEAEPLYERAISVREKTLGPDHPNTGYTLNNLAALYRDQGRYDKAQPLYQRALAVCEKNAGREHADTAGSLHNLAGLYYAQRRYAEAEPLYQRALAIRENALGPDHPDTVGTLNNLAVLYRDQGRYDEAEPLHQRAIAICEKNRGPHHPHTATTLNELAVLYCRQGRYDKAEPLYQRAVAIFDKAVGPDEPNAATSLNNLATLYRRQGRLERAESLYQLALARLGKSLGPEDPSNIHTLNNLAFLYLMQCRYKEAEPLYQRALAISVKALGPDHPRSISIRTNYASLLETTGRKNAADILRRGSK